MANYSYAIIMDTPLGKKQGKMLLKTEGSMIDGTLFILEATERVHGEITETGKCKLFGRIITLTRTVEFTADGYMDEEKIDLMLQGQRNNFHLIGVACALG